MNKKLLGNSEVLEILIDSKSFNEELNTCNKDAEKILKYSKVEFLKFLRSPLHTEFKELEIIPEFNEERDEKGNLINIIIQDDSHISTTLFDYERDYINDVGVELFNKSLNREKIEELNLIFIQAALNRFNTDNTCIMITNNDFLLKKRLLFDQYTHIRTDIQKHLHILTIEEAKEFLGLFLRFQNEYIKFADPVLRRQHKCNKGLWYWYLFRYNVPNFHVGTLINEPFLDAFSTRFVYLLRSVDEIGFRYYKGVNNDTIDDMMYHFNYSISLITGIFDSLALITKNKYNLQFDDENIPQRTSLNPKVGKSFLRAIREEYPDLRKHIRGHVNFIKLIYELRELVIHGKLLEKTRFSGENNWEMGALKVDESILMYFPREYKTQKYKPLTGWGVYKNNGQICNLGGYIFLEPFEFIKNVVKVLISFSNGYLRLLGFNDFLEEQKKSKRNYSSS